jgi:anion-transporting  ArsA/GET3 family ATPase
VDPASFFAASRVVIVAGKGGVGKTVVSAALARAAAIVGLDTVLVEIQVRGGSGGVRSPPIAR